MNASLLSKHISSVTSGWNDFLSDVKNLASGNYFPAEIEGVSLTSSTFLAAHYIDFVRSRILSSLQYNATGRYSQGQQKAGVTGLSASSVDDPPKIAGRYTKTFVVPLQIEENGIVMHVGSVPGSVAVVVRTSDEIIKSVSASDITASISLDAITAKGTYTLPVKIRLTTLQKLRVVILK